MKKSHYSNNSGFFCCLIIKKRYMKINWNTVLEYALAVLIAGLVLEIALPKIKSLVGMNYEDDNFENEEE